MVYSSSQVWRARALPSFTIRCVLGSSLPLNIKLDHWRSSFTLLYPRPWSSWSSQLPTIANIFLMQLFSLHLQLLPSRTRNPLAHSHCPVPLPDHQDIPSLEEIYFTFIPTHKFAPKPARAEFSREIARLWDRLVADMNDEPSWSRSGLEGGELVSFVLSGRKQ